jgi:hypothetical protein
VALMTVNEMMLAQAAMPREAGVRIAREVIRAQETWRYETRPACVAAIRAAEELATITEGGLRLLKRG